MKSRKQQVVEPVDPIGDVMHQDAEVIDMPRPLPQVIQLTGIERISAENLNLKMRLLESEYASAKRQIIEADKMLSSGIAHRLGVDLSRYALDFSTGTGKLKETN
jgi:hypothetical protein